MSFHRFIGNKKLVRFIAFFAMLALALLAFAIIFLLLEPAEVGKQELVDLLNSKATGREQTLQRLDKPKIPYTFRGYDKNHLLHATIEDLKAVYEIAPVCTIPVSLFQRLNTEQTSYCMYSKNRHFYPELMLVLSPLILMTKISYDGELRDLVEKLKAEFEKLETAHRDAEKYYRNSCLPYKEVKGYIKAVDEIYGQLEAIKID